MHKRTIIAALAACLVIASIPQQAAAQDKSFIEAIKAKFFKTEDPNDPGKTLQAPFVKPGDMDMPTADKMGLTYQPYSDSEKQAMSLSEPHRDQDQVGLWLTDKVSEILDVRPIEYDDHIKSMRPIMTPEALTAFGKFMEDSTIMARMRANRLQLHAFVEQTPLLINQGAVEDRYRWLYEVPVTLTFLREGIKDYDENNTPLGTSNYRLLIRIQVGRVSQNAGQQAEADDDNQDSDHAPIKKQNDDESNKSEDDQDNQGLKIESWEARHNDMAQ